ncbi:hypothetical protein CLOP_g11017, partial [Closterium sp. NIES-67]
LALPSLHSLLSSPFLLTNPSPSLLAGHLAASESGAAEPVAERGAAAAATAAAALVDPDARETFHIDRPSPLPTTSTGPITASHLVPQPLPLWQ